MCIKRREGTIDIHALRSAAAGKDVKDVYFQIPCGVSYLIQHKLCNKGEKVKVAIYLAGPIQKGHEKVEEHWSDREKDELLKLLSSFQVSFLNPAYRTDNLSDPQSVFGRDMLQVASADLVFVDARGKRGLGVGAEMMWAKYHAIPVVTWAPQETHYKKSNASLLGTPIAQYIHPFVHSLSDVVVDTLQEAASWTEQYMHGKQPNIKGMPHVLQTVAHYVDTQLKHDVPMSNLMLQDERLSQKLDLLLHRTSSSKEIA